MFLKKKTVVTQVGHIKTIWSAMCGRSGSLRRGGQRETCVSAAARRSLRDGLGLKETAEQRRQVTFTSV